MCVFIAVIILPMPASHQYAHCMVWLLRPLRHLAVQKPNYTKYRYAQITSFFLVIVKSSLSEQQ